MMRGKSPRSDVEKTIKTKFRGGHLGFLLGISQSILTKLDTHISNIHTHTQTHTRHSDELR